MNASHLNLALTLLDTLRRELIDEAFDLEQQGRLDAADLAIATAGRIALTGWQLQRARRGVPNEPSPPLATPDLVASETSG